MPVVCGLNLPSEELKARGPGYFSSGIHHRRIGTESSVTRPGCVKPARLNGCASERKSSTNYFLIHPLVGGSQRCKIYLGALLNPILRRPILLSAPGEDFYLHYMVVDAYRSSPLGSFNRVPDHLRVTNVES